MALKFLILNSSLKILLEKEKRFLHIALDNWEDNKTDDLISYQNKQTVKVLYAFAEGFRMK